MSRVTVATLSKTVEDLQAQIAALTEKLAALGIPAPAASVVLPVEAQAAPAPAPVEAEISEDILLAISAAVAAYLGERAHVRAVRLISTSRWSQEGRVSIQASHRLARG